MYKTQKYIVVYLITLLIQSSCQKYNLNGQRNLPSARRLLSVVRRTAVEVMRSVMTVLCSRVAIVMSLWESWVVLTRISIVIGLGETARRSGRGREFTVVIATVSCWRWEATCRRE